MNGKAHNVVFCNWLVMSSKEKMIRMVIFEVGLSNVKKKNQEKKHLKHIHMTVEESVMFALIHPSKELTRNTTLIDYSNLFMGLFSSC